MANQFKNLGLILFFVTAGIVFLFLGLRQKPVNVADPVPAMGIVISPQGALEAGFSIQVHSFQDKARAEAALVSLKNSGYKAFMIMSDLGERGVWYRVRVGPIPEEAGARKLLGEIRKNYNSGFIVKQ